MLNSPRLNRVQDSLSCAPVFCSGASIMLDLTRSSDLRSFAVPSKNEFGWEKKSERALLNTDYFPRCLSHYVAASNGCLAGLSEKMKGDFSQAET